MIAKFRDTAPRLAPGVFVAENAAVIGDVSIGSNSSVWFGAVIRGDQAPIEIGEGSNIQDNVTLHCDVEHPMRVGDNVTIGHNAVVHCSEVGDNTLVGMGAVLLTGAVIGKCCVIGAGAVVKERAVVPDGVLMAGVPARCIRTLTEDELRLMRQGSHYTELAREYLR